MSTRPVSSSRLHASSSRESVLRRIARWVLRPWVRVRAEGTDHVPAAGPVIVASTHASHADSIALGLAVDRPLGFLGDEQLLFWPLLGPLLPSFGMIPVSRGTADTAALDRLAHLLATGGAVVVYPEGSRSRDGRVHRPRSGVARLAAATGVPVVPAGIAGTADVWPVGGRPRLLGGRVHVRFGPALAAPTDHPADRRTFSEELHRQLVLLSGAPRAESFAPVVDTSQTTSKRSA